MFQFFSLFLISTAFCFTTIMIEMATGQVQLARRYPDYFCPSANRCTSPKRAVCLQAIVPALRASVVAVCGCANNLTCTSSNTLNLCIGCNNRCITFNPVYLRGGSPTTVYTMLVCASTYFQ
jgi:hypothetical protein